MPAGLLGPTAGGWFAAAELLADRPDVKMTRATARSRMRSSRMAAQRTGRAGQAAFSALHQVLIGSVGPALLQVSTARGTCSPPPEYDIVDADIAAVVRDIVGNPFRPAAFDPGWRTEAVVALARGMYESRDFGPMPVLADALEDAGCDHPDILAHCRDREQVHVRGCWAVDLVLDKR